MSSLSGDFVSIENNLVDACKTTLGEEMQIPSSEAYALEQKYTGESLTDRLNWIQSQLVAKSADYIALNVLDEIAWLFNIRGSDIHFNPLVISYAIIGQNQSWLFVDGHKIPNTLQAQLKDAGVNLLNYAEFGEHLSSLNGSICLDPKTANFWMENKAKQAGKIIFEASPIVAAKASKNNTEAEGARIAHLKDAVAVSSFLCWLDNHWKEGVDELSCVEKLQSFRQQQLNLRGSSFDTISGFASNGAIIHYRVTPETNKKIDDSSLYLVDSGGQYLEGTTDITRTVHLGNPTAAQKRDYTLVLKGHLALARQQFPHGTCGEHLDVLARAALWNTGLNYRHGTGHGVGSFLCVHEGPQKISQAPTGVPLLPGMIVSNEPGFYLEGAYGIRVENLCLINASQLDEAKTSGFGPFYSFEDLTLVPYAKNLMEMDLLTSEEIDQIKVYYEQIRAKVRPNLGEEATTWLDNQITIN
jgi:Xaa-Pro aminopeptidase